MKARNCKNTKDKKLNFVLLNFHVFVIIFIYVPKRHINQFFAKPAWFAFIKVMIIVYILSNYNLYSHTQSDKPA